MDNNLPPPPKVLPPGAGGPLPPSVTPGWNDPPPLSTVCSSPGPKRLLNKRVPFPMAASQSPQTQQASPIFNMPPNDMLLTEVASNFAAAVNQLPNNSELVKELERLSVNWQQVAVNQEVKNLVLVASQQVKNGDVQASENVYKQLLIIPDAGWFALFLQSVIQALCSQRTYVL